MAAVVSGAVVLAQSGPEAGAGGGDTPKRAEARKDGRRDPLPGTLGLVDGSAGGDRAAALERKLDRVLEALERISSPGDSPSRRLTTPAGDFVDSMPEDRPLPRGKGVPVPADWDTVPRAKGERLLVRKAWTDDRSAADRPLSDRMQAVEEQIQGILQRLERMDEQLKSLDARIGGGRGGRSLPERRVSPMPAKR
jgi:hypothetical protein